MNTTWIWLKMNCMKYEIVREHRVDEQKKETAGIYNRMDDIDMFIDWVLSRDSHIIPEIKV